MKNLLTLLASFAVLFPASADNISLTWDLSLEADGYRLYQSVLNAPYANVATVNSPPVSVSVTQSSQFYVIAYNEGGDSGPSNIVAYTPLPPPPAGLVFEAESGTISAPFVITNGYVEQTVLTGLNDGGRAVYHFSVTQTGEYTVFATVNAPSEGSNSLFVGINAEPIDPASIWDIPVTTGFQVREASWRGSGTFNSPQFVPQVFNLAAGNHTLIIVGREGGVQIDKIEIRKRSVTPVIPNPPTNLRISTITSSRIDLRWDAPANTSTVDVEYAQSGQMYKVAATVPSTQVTYSKSGLRKNTSYVFRARGRNAAGYSAYSNQVTGRTTR